MFNRSLRTPQFTQTTGMSLAWNAAINDFNGPIGALLGLTSMPRECIQPPSVQKSFCMSTISRAVFDASTVMVCGSATSVTGRTGVEGLVMST